MILRISRIELCILLGCALITGVVLGSWLS